MGCLLFPSVLSTGLLLAQTPKDYSLTLDRNAWLTSTNGAAMTTFRDSNVTKAGLYYSPLTADVASVFRLSSKTVASGRIAYSYDTDDNHTGSVFYEQDFLNPSPRSGGVGGGHPFDIIIPTPGKVKTEEISLSGAIGWQAAKSLSLGTKAEYTTSNTARQKDLRYSNFRMDLATSIGVYYSPSPCGESWGGVGLSLFYRRTTEDLAFSRAGTTDIVHTSFINYGGGLGITETFSGEGFTDDTEQPLFSEYKGLAAQINIPLFGKDKQHSPSPRGESRGGAFFLEFLYTHRTGYYGKLSQYTIRHTEHKSDCYQFHAILSLPPFGGSWRGASFLSAQINIENLENHRTNYLSQTTDGVTSYTYYAPTKTANKVHAAGHIAYISHFPPSHKREAQGGAWRLSIGTKFFHKKQTAWVYPDSSTVANTEWQPFATIRRSFPLKRKSLLTPQLTLSPHRLSCGLTLSR